MRQSFEIQPADMRKAWLIPGIVLAAATAGTALFARNEPEAWVAVPALVATFATLALVLRRRRVVLEDGVLTVAAGLNTRRVTVEALDTSTSRVVDLRERTDLNPTLRLAGTGLHGLRMGHYLLRNRMRAFVLLTSSQRTLVLAETSGRVLLLSLAHPQSLLDAIERARPASSRRP